MVKLVVKKAFRNADDFSEVFEIGREIEVSEVRAKSIQERLPGYTEEVKAKAAPKKTARKPRASKNEDDK